MTRRSPATLVLGLAAIAALIVSEVPAGVAATPRTGRRKGTGPTTTATTSPAAGHPTGGTPPAPTGRLQRRSVTDTGQPADGASTEPVAAADNPSVVAFTSTAANLGSVHGRTDAYVSDGTTITRLAAVLPPRWQQTGPSGSPSLSADGRYVAFTVAAYDTSLPTAQTLISGVVFLWDRTKPRAAHVGGYQNNGAFSAERVVLSPDGRYLAVERAGQILLGDLQDKAAGFAPVANGREVALSKEASALAFTNDGPLVADDTNGSPDVYVLHNPTHPATDPARRLERVSVGPDGREGNGPSDQPSISGDGNRIAFRSFATNLATAPAEDGNARPDVYVRDLGAATTIRASLSTTGAEPDGVSGSPSISLDGRYVAFTSGATTLDEAGAANGPEPPDAVKTNFAVVDRTGAPIAYGTSATPGPPGPDGTVRTVRVTFPPGALTAATGASVNPRAVVDRQLLPTDNDDGRSNTNPFGVLGRKPAGSTAAAPALSTDGPDLRSVTLHENRFHTGYKVADWCFDKVIDTVGDANLFVFQGYDSTWRHTFGVPPGGSPYEAASAARSPDDAHCARLTFPDPGVDLKEVTVGVAKPGAVKTKAGRANPREAVGTTKAGPLSPSSTTTTSSSTTTTTAFLPIPGSAARPAVARPAPATGDRPAAGVPLGPRLRVNGAATLRDYTTAPDVIQVLQATGEQPVGGGQTRPTNRLDYVFDRNVSIIGREPSRFGFYDEGGVLHRGSGFATDHGQEILVDFPSDAPVTTAVRYFVAEGAAVSEPEGGQGQRNPAMADFGATAAPYLTQSRSTGRVGTGPDERFEITFTSPVATLDASKFAFYTEDASRFTADRATLVHPSRGQSNTVSVRAPVADFLDKVVFFTAEPGAATTKAGTRAAASSSVVTVKESRPSGRTDGPDLIDLAFDPASNSVTYTFDDPLRPDDTQLSPRQPAIAPHAGSVFVHDLVAGHTARVSTDAAGADVAGDSGSPALTGNGRYVFFASEAPLLAPDSPPAAGGVRDVFRRDLASARLDPATVTFGAPVILGQSSPAVSVAVDNDGFGPVTVGSAALSGPSVAEYRLATNPCTNVVIDPGAPCRIGVVFTPAGVGERRATLTVTDDTLVGPSQATLDGLAANAPGGPGPSVTVDPRLGPPGSVASVSGRGFPPNRTLTVQWAPASAGAPSPITAPTSVTTDPAGAFGPLPLLLFRGDMLGPRIVLATALPDIVAFTPFLAVPGSYEPAGNAVTRILLGRDFIRRR